MKLNRKDLLCSRAYIGVVGFESENTFEVQDPYDQTVLSVVPDLDAAAASKAIDQAEMAFTTWKKVPPRKRANLLKRFHQLILDNQEDLALLLSMEQGKPLPEARGEIRYGAAFVEWFAEEAPRVYGDIIPGSVSSRRMLAIKQPVGVVAAITPWNFPNAMITRKIAPALAAGCTVVIKPAEDTPLSALALAVLAEEAGFPDGVINVITSKRPAEIGQELTSNKKVRKLSFTGSTEVGKLLMKQCASTIKRLSLELGGNAPFIVFDDANIEDAVDGAIASKYRNAGQTCICANRLYVNENVYDSFVELLSKKVAALKVGRGIEEHIDVGPLINKEAVVKVDQLVLDAVQKGAELLLGGHPGEGQVYQPTVMSNIKPSMEISQAEIFGPVMPVISFKHENEVIELANATNYGLAAYFYGKDHARIWEGSRSTRVWHGRCEYRYGSVR